MKPYENLIETPKSKNGISLKILVSKGNRMKKIILFCIAVYALASCSPKSYFTVGTRSFAENNNIPLTGLQYYVNRDVVLKRELSSGEAKLQTSGKIITEQGKYIHIITLQKNTPGVCPKVGSSRSLDISFETEDQKYLTFGSNISANPDGIYQILAQEWDEQKVGKVIYDGKVYYIQPGGGDAKLMYMESKTNKNKTEKNRMKGRKVNQ